MKRLLFLSLLVGLCLPFAASATGLLVPTDNSMGPLAIKYHRAEVKITDRAAVTHVDQVFINNTDRDLEATYIFPLPRGATVSDFYLYMNGKKMKGEILEKDRARNIYEGIVRRMQDPGLLEYLGNDLFQARVYPVPRRGEQRVEIEFTQLLPFEGGVLKYVYPMRTDRTSARTLQDFTVAVKIHSQVPIKTIYSPSHQIYQRKTDDRNAVAGFETMAALLDRDFELFYTVSEKDIGLNLLAFREPGEDGFFMVMASPKSEFTDKEIMGKRITFVVDTSGSMSGDKMRFAKEALKYCLNRLNGDDIFNVVRFSTDVESFEKAPVAASRDNVQRALTFVDRMEAAGGTAIDEALMAALAGHTKKDEPNLVVFITDGHPTVGETNPKEILAHIKAKNAAAARVFAFGVGDDINTLLLDQIGQENFADATYLKANQEIEQRLSAFYDKISHPVLADLRIDFGSLREFDVFPRRLPDLFKGSQLIILGRYRNEGHTAITLVGKVGGKDKSFTYEGAFPKEARDNAFIPRLWATRKIGYLLDNIRQGGERKELVDEVIALSKRYGIVTPYTSYLVTEDTPQMVAAEPRPRPVPPPPRRPLVFEERMQVPGKGDGAVRGGAAPVTAAPPMSAPAMDYERRAERAKVMAKSSATVRAESGAEAVQMADAVKDLKEAEAPRDEADDAAGIRYVEGRTFRFQGGGWVDAGFSSSMKTLHVKYMGAAYFALVQRSAKLKRILALGERVTVVVGNNLALIVSPDGRDQVPEAELNPFVMR
ncbi:MAG: VWA domain-containing protein [Myxococcales bacterium]|nr:VWA domain-containing protein [Myxococcales bacterium]